MKGKLWTLAGGLLVPVLLWVGALRLAKPDSWWARSEYDEEQMERATVRYGVS
jgi:lysyl-tRNA synthetase class 2